MKNFLFDLLFPKICLNCGREEEYLCQDCEAILEISKVHSEYKTQHLPDLYYPCDYRNPLIKKLIKFFKYEPFLKDLSKPLSSLIIGHIQLIENPPPFLNDGQAFVLTPAPLEKRKLKWRGFNQAEELAKEISRFYNLKLLNDVLIKNKETPSQVELTAAERKENIKNAFSVINDGKIKGKRILLIGDVYTTGSTMEECSRAIIKAGGKEIIGLVVARAKPEEDSL